MESRTSKLSEKKIKKQILSETAHYYIKLTLILSVLLILTYYWYFILNKSFVWNADGLSQHLPSFIYFGHYIRGIFENIVTNFDFTIPLFDFNIGYGSDILTTLNYYTIGDPLSLFSIFTPERYAEYMFSALVLLRLYLSGIAFSIYAKSIKFNNFQALVGSIIYVFCGLVLFGASRHPFFINPMIYFPLICLGLDNILQHKSVKLFIVMIFISCASNFYFFYMLTILLFLYALMRYAEKYSFKDFKTLRQMALKTLFSYIIGVLMSAAVLLPVINLFLSTDRQQATIEAGFFYPLSYYANFLASFISPSVSPGSSWTFFSYLPISLLCIFILFLKKDKQLLPRKILFIGLTALFLLPVFGSILNGFSYTTNRWNFGYTFLLALISGQFIEDFLTLDKVRKQQLVSVSVSVGYILLLLISRITHNANVFLGVLFLVAYLLALYVFENQISKLKWVLLVIMTVNVFAYGSYAASPFKTNLVSSYEDTGLYNRQYGAWQSTAVKNVTQADTDWSRYETFDQKSWVELNAGMLTNMKGMNYYFSLANSTVFDFQKAVSNPINSNYSFYGLNRRSDLTTLANGKYYVQSQEIDSNTVPFGYEPIGKQKFSYNDVLKNYTVYQNKNYLPFGYTYDSYLTRNDIKMNPMNISEYMLNTVILEDNEASTLKKGESLQNSFEEIPYSIESTMDTPIDLSSIQTKQPDSRISLKIEPQELSDNDYIFVQLNGLEFQPTSPFDVQNNTENWEHLSDGTKTLAKLNNRYWTPVPESNITIFYGGVGNIYTSRSKAHQWYAGIEDILLNQGKVSAATSIDLTFDVVGKYSFNSIKVYKKSYASLAEQVTKLGEDRLDNTIFESNKITGDISLAEDKFLLLTIPYSRGWNAYVDGKKVELEQANIMFSGIQLSSGNHKIELRYRTPWLVSGLLVSVVGFALFGLIAAFERSSKQSFKKTQEASKDRL